MGQGTVTKVTRKSWFSRIGDSIKGILFGLLLFLASFPLLWWNEGRAVTTYKSLQEGASSVVSISADQVDPEKENHLVHLTGKAITDEILNDTTFGVSVNAIKLQRSVEMYQWRERKTTRTENRVGGSTETVETFSYEKTWSSSLIDSSRFENPTGHQNPGSFPHPSTTFTARNVTVGAFRLNPALIANISNFRSLEMTDTDDVPAPLQERTTLHNGGYYIGANPADPQIGDLRISFRVVEPTAVSLIARQVGDSFSPYQTQAGRDLQMLSVGVHTAEAMFEQAQASNVRTTWILRFVGFALMSIGLGMVFNVLKVVADVLPILGKIVGTGVSLITSLISAVLSLLTIAIAWIYYRPLLGISLLIVGFAIMVFVIMKIKGAKPVQPTGSEAVPSEG